MIKKYGKNENVIEQIWLYDYYRLSLGFHPAHPLYYFNPDAQDFTGEQLKRSAYVDITVRCPGGDSFYWESYDESGGRIGQTNVVLVDFWAQYGGGGKYNSRYSRRPPHRNRRCEGRRRLRGCPRHAHLHARQTRKILNKTHLSRKVHHERA